MRRAFTLLEVLVALVVTSLVVSLAYAALQAAFDTRDRLDLTREGEEREAVARALLSGALRHALSGTLGGEPVFVLQDGPSDRLVFRTRGVAEPLGATEAWEIEVTATDDGLRLAGTPLEDDGAAFVTTLPRVRALDVRVRGRDARDGWLEAWPFADRSPVAVRLAFLDARGRATSAPLVARIGLEGNR